MMVAVVAVLCQALAGPPVCREEIVADADMAIGFGCLVEEGRLDLWKAHSIYAGSNWTVRRVMCVPGGYVPKERT